MAQMEKALAQRESKSRRGSGNSKLEEEQETDAGTEKALELIDQLLCDWEKS
jgi:hypothetical protein